MKVALALNCQIQNFTKFDRKHYFYPDPPKITRFPSMICPWLWMEAWKIKVKDREKTIPVKRVHLEEDAGKFIHEGEDSLVDYNRAGVSFRDSYPA